MPWNECKPMDERLRFVARLLEGEKMAPLCREFGISRVTCYRIFERYKTCGLDGLYDRSKAPYQQAGFARIFLTPRLGGKVISEVSDLQAKVHARVQARGGQVGDGARGGGAVPVQGLRRKGYWP